MIINDRIDKASKKFLIQQYVEAMINWLAVHTMSGKRDNNEKLCNFVSCALGKRSETKENYVRFLIAYLTYDYASQRKQRLQVCNKKLLCKIEEIDVYGNRFQKQISPILQTIGET